MPFTLGLLVGALFTAAACLLYVAHLNTLHVAALAAADKAAALREQQAREAGYLDGATNYQIARTL